jgi:peptidylprolyl isomerase
MLAACTPAEAPPLPDTHDHRPADGLLSDTALQSVVEAQVARSWEPLVGFLGHERAEVRARAAFALASVQAPEAVAPLAGLLGDVDAGVRRDAAFALGQSGDLGVAPAIFQALEDEAEPAVRHRLLEALGKLASPGVLEGLLDLRVSGADEADRLLAIARQGAVHGYVTSASLGQLAGGLGAQDALERRAAAYFFGRVRNASLWASRAREVRGALEAHDLEDPAALHLVKALARLQDPSDRARLARIAGSAPDWRLRAEAMLGLAGADPGDGELDVLLAGLNDVSIHVAVNAANTLAGSQPAPSTLTRMATWVEGNPDRWQVAAPLLEGLARASEGTFVLGWLDAVPAGDEARRVVGLQALASLPGEEALSRLVAGSGSPSDRVAGAAILALRRRWRGDGGDPGLQAAYFEAFSAAVASGRASLVSSAAPGLADPAFASLGNVEVLLDAFRAAEMSEDIATAQVVLGSLGQTGDAVVRAELRQALGHPWADVRRTAALALGQHFGEDVEVSEGGLEAGDATGPEGSDPTRIDWPFLSSLGPTPHLVLETERGELVIRMSTEEAPHTVQTVARLALEGRFHGTPFHRVVPNFVIQGGDVGSGDGRGGPGFAITTESTLIPYRRGVIGMASAGKDTEGSQFFVVHSAQPHLDGGYTAFGWLVAGAEVLDGVRQGDLLRAARVEPGG